MSLRTTVFLVVALLGGGLGLFYSGSSTVDFTNHLDRQLHPVSCSLLAGLQESSLLDESAAGCKAALFSPYSSFWRDRYWGGIPWSLPAMGLFGFALALALWGLVTRRGHEVAVSVGLMTAGSVALISSAVFFSIAMGQLHTVCKTCVGTYISSVLLDLGAVLVFLSAWKDRKAAGDQADRPSVRASWIGSLVVLAELGLAVGVPFLVYRAALPDYQKYVTQCGTLKTTEDKRGVLLPLTSGDPAGKVPAVMVVDPQCPACAAFHQRLKESPWFDRLAIQIAPLPLDKDCNWMMTDSMHPGSCLLTQAMICAKDRAGEVLEWSFQHQKEFRPIDKADRPAQRIREALLARWPEWKGCLDTPETRIALTSTLNWAVDQSLPVLTPQLYIQGKRLCDEDTDLGLEYAMTHLLGTR
ncbi:MAG TPA: vitamin K epoxide reductase family protein [Myxococcota bacterium]|nr:vitamin K epoxide reductase family protein [Myxococcota bacterium]HQK50123.1 vitamin K epoxide reductase family protein [Myxococcota bacterium]